ncbi:MAG: glycosyltransferase family 4 protein [Pseudomonadota bacterium]
MRLIFLNRYYWPDESATSQMLTDLAEALARRGYSVTVMTSRQKLEQARPALEPLGQHGGVTIQRLWTTSFGRAHLLGRALDYLSFYLSAIWSVLRQVRRGDIVIAKTDPPLLGAILEPFVRLKRGALVNWLQDVYPEVAVRLGVLSARSPLTRVLMALRDRSLRRAKFNVVIGERMREYLAGRIGPTAKLHVIHNWAAPIDWTAQPNSENPLRRQLGLDSKVVFGYSGNLGRAHRFESLLAAGEQLKNRKDLHFLFIGSGAQFELIQRAVTARGLGNWTFLPHQPRERLAESLAAADVHLVSLDPALEGLIVPSKIYGVLAAGRPCIFIGATDGEVALILAHHRCGVSALPNRQDELAQAILRLAEDHAERLAMGERAQAAAARFAPANVVLRWHALLAQPPQR